MERCARGAFLPAVHGGMAFIRPAERGRYEAFLKARNKVFREISHMQKLSAHKNVLALERVLEMTEDSKMTIFLVLELAKGGELFDRIAVDQGAEEETARTFFRQLLDGLRHCHEQGVCHRDLKPENLLLADEVTAQMWTGRVPFSCTLIAARFAPVRRRPLVDNGRECR